MRVRTIAILSATISLAACSMSSHIIRVERLHLDHHAAMCSDSATLCRTSASGGA